MKKYSVKQIAEMLHTTEETVRRWIRDGKLKANQVSRKDGNVIEENEFQRFLKVSPKYAKIVTGTNSYTPSNISGLVGGAIGSLVGSLVIGYCEDRKERDFQISAEDIENYIHEAIFSYEKSIKKKNQDIKHLNDEIAEERKNIDDLKSFLENIKTGNKTAIQNSRFKEEGAKNGR